MKSLRTLALAVPLAGLFALVAAGSSSATVLCSTKANPCPAAQKVPVGTFAKGSLKPGTSAKFTSTDGQTIFDTCTGVVISGTLGNAGNATETVGGTGEPKNVTWSGCSFPMTTIAGGTIEVHHIAGTVNGTVTIGGFKTTLNTVLFGSCVYGYTSGTDAGVITGGEKPSLDVNVVVEKMSGSAAACPETLLGSAEGILTEPTNTPIYVEDS